MSIAPNSKYMESKVLTASQPQLHLMLLEGAVRYGQRAKEVGAEEQHAAEADVLLVKLLNIVEELSRSTSGRDNEISVQLEDEYAFLYRELTASRVNLDLTRLEKCLEILNYQRDTWKQACEQMEFVADTTTSSTTLPPLGNLSMPQNTSSFSLDA